MEPPENYRKQTERIRVRIETSRYAITGTVHPPAIAYRSRLSDLLNQKEAVFLSVTDVEASLLGDPSIVEYTTPFLAVNLNSIETVRPLEE